MSIRLNTDKAYLLGLLVGGGIMKSGTIQIVLPFRKWGKIEVDPSRGGVIATDILQKVKPLWKAVYGLDVSYEIGNSSWTIVLEGSSPELNEDLLELGLSKVGIFRDNANITPIVGAMGNKELIRQFIAGLVDTVGSLAKSHRRFSGEFQIISFEFTGQNYSLVTSVLGLFFEIGITPDQVLWNHPNSHSGLNRYYKQWKKGFKIRVALDDYLIRGSFVFQSKQLSAQENQKIEQTGSKTSKGKTFRVKGITCLHVDEYSNDLSPCVRGHHFIHFTHLASYLGKPFPGADIVSNPQNFITPFTVLTKGALSEIESIIANEDYLCKTVFQKGSLDVLKIREAFDLDKKALVFGNSPKDGFPAGMILQAIAYLASATKGDLHGKRVKGSYLKVIDDSKDILGSFRIWLPKKGTCLVLENGKNAAMIGYQNANFTKTLLKCAGNDIQIRNPTYEECVDLINC